MRTVLQIIETYTAKNIALNWHTFGQQYSQKSSEEEKWSKQFDHTENGNFLLR